MLVHDLNLLAHFFLGRGEKSLFFVPRSSCVGRSIRVCAIDGFSAASRLQRLRKSVSRQSSSARFFVSRSISVLGFRAADVSRKLARHRNLSASAETEVVSRRLSRKNIAKYFGGCKSGARLAHLCRLRAGSHWPCA